MNPINTSAKPASFALGVGRVIPVLLTVLAVSPSVMGQEETFSFDWSGIAERHMRVALTGGGVTVQGHESEEVTIVVSQAMSEAEEAMMTENGLRRLPNGGQNLVVRQDGGEIILRAGTADEYAQILIRMPHDARLTVNSSMEGSIRVDDIHGELELQASNGTIEAFGIRSSAALHAHADDLTATISTTELPGPLTISSWAGNVDLQMPEALRANLRWRTNYGKVLTDLDVSDVETVLEREESEDGTRLEGFTQGRLNGGGPEISVTTFAGDIVMRRTE